MLIYWVLLFLLLLLLLLLLVLPRLPRRRGRAPAAAARLCPRAPAGAAGRARRLLHAAPRLNRLTSGTKKSLQYLLAILHWTTYLSAILRKTSTNFAQTDIKIPAREIPYVEGSPSAGRRSCSRPLRRRSFRGSARRSSAPRPNRWPIQGASRAGILMLTVLKRGIRHNKSPKSGLKPPAQPTAHSRLAKSQAQLGLVSAPRVEAALAAECALRLGDLEALC